MTRFVIPEAGGRISGTFFTLFHIGALALAALSFEGRAFAQSSDPNSKWGNSTSPLERPHTVAEIEVGILALPTAPISPSQRGGNTPLIGRFGRGDATLQTGMHLLYRATPEIAVGAGILFGPQPTSTDTQGEPGLGGPGNLSRTHSRSYLLVGTEGRYIPFRVSTFEGWVGVTAGAVIVSDRFTTDTEHVPTILGTPEINLRTEGFAFGVEAGVSWIFASRWLAGFTGRVDRWLLPNSQQCDPINDCTTLTGTLVAFEIGLSIGYRIPL